MRHKNKIPAFTLVELIVVITIIAILGTIGFISYSNYLTTARDSNRISQLTRIADALQTYSTREILPLPENYITITDGSNAIAYQGDLGEQLLQAIEYSTTARDPRDNSPFTYMLSASRNHFQLLALMEDPSNLQTLHRKNSIAHANLSNRHPKTYGARLGVLTDANNTPIQRLTIEDNTLDITNNTLALKSFLSDTEFVEGTGSDFSELTSLIPQRGRFWSVVDNEFVYTGTEELAGGSGGGSTPPPSNRYPGCDTDDITVGSFTIAACNVGATTASTDWTISGGSYFQWGRNKPFAYNESSPLQTTQIDGSVGLNASSDNFGFVGNSSLTNGDWATTVSPNTNNWGGASGDNASRQGPCAPGYRVPTSAEWTNLRDAGVTAGLWLSNGGVAMQTELQLPYAGYRDSYDGAWYNGGSDGHYWSSTPTGTSAHYLRFFSSHISPSDPSSRKIGYSVRCFKN